MFEQSFYYCNKRKAVFYMENESMFRAPVIDQSIMHEEAKRISIVDPVNNNNFFELLRLVLKGEK